MDTKFKKNIVMQNNYICKFGPLQNKTNYTSYKNQFNENYSVGVPLNFCDVFVVKLHPLTIAREFVNCNLKPVMVNLINDKYTDHNIENLEGVYDEILNMRTNFQCISRQNNNFPPREEEVIYTPQVMVIRDEMLNIAINNIFTVSFITASLKKSDYEILAYKENDDSDSDSSSNTENSEEDIKNIKLIFSVETYLIFKNKLELIFQTAHFAGNNVIIFNDFGCLIDELPVDDIVDIFNSCILKYGHLFKQIIFAIFVRTPIEQTIHDKFLEGIFKPQDVLNNENEEDKQQDELLANILIQQTNPK
jgi:hypothetical protein